MKHADTKKSNHFRTHLSPLVPDQHQPTPRPSRPTSVTCWDIRDICDICRKRQVCLQLLAALAHHTCWHILWQPTRFIFDFLRYHATPMKYIEIPSNPYTSSRLWCRLCTAPVTVEIRSVTFSNIFACNLLPMNLCEHTRALSGYPLQKWLVHVMPCLFTLA